MLTRKSSAWSRSRMLLAITVLTLSLLCFSKNAFSDFKRVRKGNKVTFNGNEFELIESAFKNVHFQNPETGLKEEMKIEILPYPVKLNNIPLPGVESVDKKPTALRSLNDYIREQLQNNKTLFGQLEDGLYSISIFHFVSGENGEVLYYEYDGLKSEHYTESADSKSMEQKKVNPVNVKAKIDELIDKMAIAIKFTPAIKDGKAVPCFTEYGIGSPFFFNVKNHVAREGKIGPGTYKLIHYGDESDTLEIMDVEFLPK